jgi:dienelactone hydrolase
MTRETSGPEGARAEIAALLSRYEPVPWRIDAREKRASAGGGFRCERLRLAAPDGRAARAFLTGPEGSWEGLPGVVYCHAHGNRHDIGAVELIAGRPALIDPPYALALAQAGFVAICGDLPCFGERAAETESSAAKRHLWLGTTLFGEMLGELAGLPDVLAEAGADSARIGAMGISMGATLAFWLGALDPRIAAVAQLCCFADIGTLLSGGAHDLHGIYMVVPGLAARFPTGDIAGLIAPRRQLICIGSEDPLTPPAAAARALADVRRCYERAGAGAALEVLVQQGVGHRETEEMRGRVIRFLRS